MANEPILKIKDQNGEVREITVEQLCASNHLTYQALVTLLVKKGVITQEELLDEVNRVQNQRFGNDE